jgi:biopolymer transport protein ExbD
MSNTSPSFGRKTITRKVKNLRPRIDLTAMVSVSFLLIVFFMLTSCLSKPQAMELGMPEKCHKEEGVICCGICFSDNRSMTILLGENNRLVLYQGYFSFPLDGPKKLSFDKNSLRKALLAADSQLQQQTGDPKKGLIVLIKPSNASNYGDLVGVLDEMAICKISTYAVVDITPEEEKLLRDY